jgi:hypothetical protein
VAVLVVLAVEIIHHQVAKVVIPVEEVVVLLFLLVEHLNLW